MPDETNKKSDLLLSDWPEWSLLDSQIDLIKRVQIAARKPSSPDLDLLFPLLDSIDESTSTVQLLVRRFAIRDAYVIARVVYETSINACFILTNPADLSVRAKRHAKQKVLRDLERTIEVLGDRLLHIKYADADKMMAIDSSQELLQEFTSKSGREITSWTPENVQKRMEAIYETFGRNSSIGLALGILLYRHASEIAHGTLFGTLFSWGAMSPGPPIKVEADIQAFRVDQGRLILKLIGFVLGSVVQITAGVLLLPDVAATARETTDTYLSRSKNCP